ncbi:carboxylesterase family protein [Nocardiopsis sp. MG754419]|uniref:carboxylesterase family protein n=1 Tax=Nocardiopsis sp. MG754419 TaxID=2259865 RepID=UPI001BA730EC|nr:carboxylesterase family protein [Nocardiopsis sp. MG754419]MBR8741790.1 carboxylesterase/lipase family protein [Nocardiopsis sp. MG754419]
MTESTSVSRDELRHLETPAGPISGTVREGVLRFLGIPYARAERFAPPVPEPVFTAPFEATAPAPASPQSTSEVVSQTVEGIATGRHDEHCQRLSVTVPVDLAEDERPPVLVWFHGGSYVTGSGDLAIFDPTRLVTEQRVIVVAVTFRLGVLGYLRLPGVAPANLGLLDQVIALRWVADNIAAFGGDPDRVTLFGQSAGGDSVAHLMIGHGTEGLFRRAIVQSAPLGLLKGRDRMYEAMARVVGAPDAKTDTRTLLALQQEATGTARGFGLPSAMPFGVRYGHDPLPAESDRDRAWSEVAPRVDLLVGATHEETGLFAEFLPPIKRISGLPVVGPVLRRMLVRATTWIIYTGPVRAFARRHRRAGGTAFRYTFTWRPKDSPFGSAHITDLPLLLGTRESWEHASLVGRTTWEEIDRRGRAVRRVWGEFARTGVVSPEAASAAADSLTVHRS